MDPIDELLRKAEAAHGHMCPGQVLGVRMALLGLERLAIADPLGADRKRLITYVEIDRCASDAISLVTGCRLGKRSLKFRDWGKMATTFVDLAADRAIRIAALDSSRQLADRLYPEIESSGQRQIKAYRNLADQDLFSEQWVRVKIAPSDLPGHKNQRVSCVRCGEGISFDRFSVVGGEQLCLGCADPSERYWEPVKAL
jgi:formylmethanofuran dehydrogenase subunit E